MTRKPPVDLTRLPEQPEKRLMPELLPKPEPVIPSAPRARVQAHMRGLLGLGTAALSLSCGPMVCDPLPPPAQCRNTGSVLSSIQVTAVAVGASQVDVVVRDTDTSRARGVRLTLSNITGGTSTAQSSTASDVVITQRVTPTSAASVIELTFAAQCESTNVKSIRVVLTPAGLDGGAADAGTAAAYTVSVTEQ